MCGLRMREVWSLFQLLFSIYCVDFLGKIWIFDYNNIYLYSSSFYHLQPNYTACTDILLTQTGKVGVASKPHLPALTRDLTCGCN